MSQQTANLHTLGPIVVARKSGGGGGGGRGQENLTSYAYRRLEASKVYCTYVKVINILRICYLEPSSFLRLYIMNVSDSLEFPES